MYGLGSTDVAVCSHGHAGGCGHDRQDMRIAGLSSEIMSKLLSSTAAIDEPGFTKAYRRKPVPRMVLVLTGNFVCFRLLRAWTM